MAIELLTSVSSGFAPRILRFSYQAAGLFLARTFWIDRRAPTPMRTTFASTNRRLPSGENTGLGAERGKDRKG